MKNHLILKLLLICAVVAWAVSSLLPIRETPFPEYAVNQANAQQEEFIQIMDRAARAAEEDPNATTFTALRDLASEERIDLTRFFPHLQVEESIRNIDRRNNLILNELLRRSQASLQLGLDLRGGVAFTLALQERARGDLTGFEREQLLDKAIEIIRDRADGLGVAEPIIRPVGDNRIEVQLPGVTTRDNPDITTALQRPARLEFRLVHPDQFPASVDDEAPPGYEVMIQEIEDPRTGDIHEQPFFVNRIPVLLGNTVSGARPVTDEYGRFSVSLNFTSEGGARFAEITGEMANRARETRRDQLLAIVLDGTLYSAPRVTEAIRGGSASITGRFSQRDAIELSNVLNNPLDVPLEIIEMYEVGPTLAEDSVDAARTAMLLGAGAVALFMIGYYLAAGIIACIVLAINVLLIVGVLASIGATLTLPGIAGIILTIGMAVDANILIFERIREELRTGKSVRGSLAAGYDKALSAIVDANVTTLFAAATLIFLGTGPVKGFGVTLAIGIFTTIFGALVVSRFLLESAVNSGFLKNLRMFSLIQDSNIDFLRFRKPAFIASWAIIAIGMTFTFVQRDTIYGIDFAGGDEIRMTFTERLATSDIEQLAANRQLGEVIPVYRSPIGGTMEELIVQTEFDRGDQVYSALRDEFPQANLELIGENRIGPAVGAEIRTNAVISLVVAFGLILLYIGFRFEAGYGVAGVAAVIHDVLMTIGIFVLSGRQFTAPMVAGILMVVGYSINDKIVIFDRIREQLGLDPDSKLMAVINTAINRTLSRTLLTSITTLLATGALYLFGGGVINDFAFIFMVGIITGTFSSIFIASPIFSWWHKGDRKHVEERKDVLPNYEWVASSKASKS